MAENYIAVSAGTGIIETTSTASTAVLYKIYQGPTLGMQYAATASFTVGKSLIQTDGGPGTGLQYSTG